MKKIRYYFGEIWHTLGQSIYTGKRLEGNLTALSVASVLSMILGIVMMVLDLYQRDFGMAIAGAATFVFGACCAYFAAIRKDREKAILFPTLFCMVAFTIYTIRGTAEGGGILWSLLLPIGLSYFVSVRHGIILSAYYSLFFIIFFSTSLSDGARAYYTPGFIVRFPILYLSVSIMTAFAMIQYHVATLKSLHYEENLASEVQALTKKERERRKEVEETGLQMVQTLANAIDAKDRYTNGHSFRVSEYSAILGQGIGLDKAEIEVLRLEALLHDIGKIGIPDTILNKPGRLSDIEFHIIQSHTELGAKILKNVVTLSGARDVALSHHERYNGKGYPKHLAGDEIPLHARIVGIADAYDAMHSNRVYRPALSEDAIREELVRGSGSQFDPTLLKYFLELLDAGKMVAPEIHTEISADSYDSITLEALSREVQEIVAELPEVKTESGDQDQVLNCEDFNKSYKYIKSIAARYNLEFEMVMVHVDPRDGILLDEDKQKQVTAAMEQAIRRTTREVDICTQWSDTEILAVFLGAETPNVERIMQRVLMTYFKMLDGSDLNITWENPRNLMN